ncbi:hypothetical protein B0H11DRAFT_2005842 [Mycena galericulata]|nr:hypothetical protein B0H11DRAFT_2005842 [Mycena galericulata]
MFTSIVFTAVLASSAALLSQAIVTPNEPGPGDSFNEGAACSIGWAGDTTGSTAWKSMSIELMTGSNEAMTHVTTVASNQDGTVAGTFSYTCPPVNPNSPIYFYQFTSCATPNITWTGRFTIAGTDGSSTPASQTEQFDGQPVAFGTGVLVDPSTAVAAPTCGSSNSSGGSASSPSGTPTASQQSIAATTPSGTPTLSRQTSPSPTPTVDTSAQQAGAAQPSGKSGALSVGLATHTWPVFAALSVSALAFTILL